MTTRYRMHCRMAVISGLLMASCAINSGCDATSASATSAADPPKVTVQNLQQRELVDYEEYSGWLQASETVEIRSRVRGHIDKVHFTDGQLVKDGDLLFELDPRPFQAEIDRATEQANIYLAQTERASKEEERYKELLKKGASTQSQVDEMVAATKSFQAQYLSALEEIKRRKLDMEYSKITAPISGRISRAYLTAGNLVNAGGSDPVLTTVVRVNPIQIYIYVDERSLQNYRARQLKAAGTVNQSLKEAQIPIEFGRDIDTGYPYRGTLDFAENRIDSGTGTIQVRAEVANDDALFVPGERVRVRIPISDKYQGLLVPETAILTDQDKKYVLCLGDDNIVVRRNITPGRLLDDGKRVILGVDKDSPPLTTENRVIVLGLQRARINYPVEPVDSEGKPIVAASR